MQYAAQTNIILVGAGVVTAIPLLLFATAAKNQLYNGWLPAIYRTNINARTRRITI